jgi:hypothetical protein
LESLVAEEANLVRLSCGDEIPEEHRDEHASCGFTSGNKNGSDEFLDDLHQPPRVRRLGVEGIRTERLARLYIGSGGVAYNAAFELGRLNECAGVLPQFNSWVKDIEGRTIDLLQPFRDFNVYQPVQKGSCSMKATLPGLTGSGYDHLEIQDGGMASNEFLRVTFGGVSDGENKEVRRRLLEYCCLDTIGMVQIVNGLRQLSI